MRVVDKADDMTGKLAETDFSRECINKDKMKEQLLIKLAYQQNNPKPEAQPERKRFHLKPAMVPAAALMLSLSFSMLAYGEDILRIIREFSLGEYANYYIRDVEPLVNSLPPEVQGQLFDAEGNELYAMPENEEMFTADGQPAQLVYDASLGTLSIVSQEVFQNMLDSAGDEDTNCTRFDNIDDVRPHLAFDFIMPTVFPKGYSFDHATLYNDEDGKIFPKEQNQLFDYRVTNEDKTKEIMVLIRLLDEGTPINSFASKNMKELTINGRPALLDGSRLDIEIDGVLYTFMDISHPSEVTEEELIRMAESIQ